MHELTIAEHLSKLHSLLTTRTNKTDIQERAMAVLTLQHRLASTVQLDYDRTTYVYTDGSVIHTGCDHMGWSGHATYLNIEELRNHAGITIR